jgi:hypothetical protein
MQNPSRITSFDPTSEVEHSRKWGSLSAGSDTLGLRSPTRQQVLPDTTGHFPTAPTCGRPVQGGKRLDSLKEVAVVGANVRQVAEESGWVQDN